MDFVPTFGAPPNHPARPAPGNLETDMKIYAQMELGQIAEMMGADATETEAQAMVEFLLVGDYADTDEISETEWLELCGLAAQGVARNAELDASRK
jgi:hypothetical protein